MVEDEGDDFIIQDIIGWLSDVLIQCPHYLIRNLRNKRTNVVGSVSSIESAGIDAQEEIWRVSGGAHSATGSATTPAAVSRDRVRHQIGAAP